MNSNTIDKIREKGTLKSSYNLSQGFGAEYIEEWQYDGVTYHICISIDEEE